MLYIVIFFFLYFTVNKVDYRPTQYEFVLCFLRNVRMSLHDSEYLDTIISLLQTLVTLYLWFCVCAFIP